MFGFQNFEFHNLDVRKLEQKGVQLHFFLSHTWAQKLVELSIDFSSN